MATLISARHHVVSIWELGRQGPLRLIAYDPRTSVEYEALLTEVERRALGCISDDVKAWSKGLIGRLSVRKANAKLVTTDGTTRQPRTRLMAVDKTVFSTASRVPTVGCNKHFLRIRASLLESGTSLALDLSHAGDGSEGRLMLGVDVCSDDGLRQDASVEPGDVSTSCTPSFRSASAASLFTGTDERDFVRQVTQRLRLDVDTRSAIFLMNGDKPPVTVKLLSKANDTTWNSLATSRMSWCTASPNMTIIERSLTCLKLALLRTRRQADCLKHSMDTLGDDRGAGEFVSMHKPLTDVNRARR